MKHVITIELWRSERMKDDPDDSSRVLRWVCSCGRIGPGNGVADGELNAWKRSQRGGDGHIRRWTR